MAIGKKLVAVMNACRYMPKDGYNDYQKYKYATAAGMFAKINDALTAEGLYTTLATELQDMRELTTAKGNVEKFVVVKVQIRVCDAETGESVVFEGLGSGQDLGDKAIAKAQTMALKYAYIGGLCIAMADDPEAGNYPPQNYPPQNYQQPARQNYPPPQSSQEYQSNSARQEQKNFGSACAECGRLITPKVAEYSTKKYGKPLCMDCQREA